MTSEPQILDFLRNMWVKLQIFAARPVVLVQLVTVLVLLVVLGVATRAIITLLIKPERPRGDVEEGTPVPFEYSLRIAISLLVYPILALGLTYLVSSVLSNQGYSVGLLDVFIGILWVLFAYHFLLGILYLFFAEDIVRRFHRRLLNPLFVLYVIAQTIGFFVDTRAAANLALGGGVAENPVTLGALFLATIGLYFWTDGVLGINEVIRRVATRFTNINAGRLEASLTLGGYVLVFVGVVLALSVLGVDSTTFAAIMAGLSVGIGFGLQTVLGNFVSGILLLFEGNIRPGDWIDINKEWVEIQKMSINSTLVRSFNGYEIIVPNRQMLDSPVITYTGSDDLYRLALYVRVAYGHDPEQAMNVIQEIVYKMIEDDPYIMESPPPKFFLMNFDDNLGMLYRVRIWIDGRNAAWPAIRTNFYMEIMKQFKQHGLSVASLELNQEWRNRVGRLEGEVDEISTEAVEVS